MAAVRLKYSLIYFSTLCYALMVSAVTDYDYVKYELEDDFPKNNVNQVSLVLLRRERRYVETAIPRLADNYYKQDVLYPGKTLDKDDLGTFSRRRGRMEMLGSLAVNSEEFAMAASFNPGESRTTDHAATEKVPEKYTKKPSGALKKNQESLKSSSISSADSGQGGSQEHDSNQTSDGGTVNVTPSTQAQATAIHHNNSDSSSLHGAGSNPHDKPTDKPSEGEYSSSTTETPSTVNFSDDDFPKDVSNNTLMKNNITEKQVDRNTYYNSTFIVDAATAKQYWIDMDKEQGVIVNQMLSKSHRRAATVKLSFEFPFYGHLVQKVTVATGGFLYTGDYIHSWLAATQYIAPLMANFDTGLSEESQVRYSDNGTAFTVEWVRVHLKDKKDAGQFTFQVTLHKNGDIVFVYRDVPILVESIEDCEHPVKVGLSDAYIMDRTVFFVRRKTIYEYHRVNFNKEDIKNWTVIYMAALPTCLIYTDCSSCVKSSSLYGCKWCGAVNRCSSGFDRHRQDWQLKECEDRAVNTSEGCSLINTSVNERQHLKLTNNHQSRSNNVNSEAAANLEHHEKSGNLGHSGVIGLLFFILAISGAGFWLLYAYRNPHTTSGQVLIKYRPSQWTLRRGEARYTAASIHM